MIMHLREDPLNSPAAFAVDPLGQGKRFGRSRIFVERNGREMLEEADDHERHFVIRELFRAQTG
ncbi:hypothetical protein H0H81_001505 [Sphagnurus paluster]|uniref:Uncharacterized protein n=1 Tax=Sphagnurus paluster TaxID=117069 RepID=A0A9P7KK26_9AGAR|nr:hypothetical protein H0H81_001505 [Sphagnurus paluster]